MSKIYTNTLKIRWNVLYAYVINKIYVLKTMQYIYKYVFMLTIFKYKNIKTCKKHKIGTIYLNWSKWNILNNRICFKYTWINVQKFIQNKYSKAIGYIKYKC